MLSLEQQVWLGKVLYQWNPKSKKHEMNKKLQMWWYSPEPNQVHSCPPGSPEPYFRMPFFLWAPQRFWNLDLRCNEECKAKQEEKKLKVSINSIKTYTFKHTPY